MIIECINCNKKFNIDSNLIPENGRLLQCNGCNHKWFFKRNITNRLVEPIKNNNQTKENENITIESSVEVKKPIEAERTETTQLFDNTVKNDLVIEKVSTNKKNLSIKNNNLDIDLLKNKKKYNKLGLIIVMIISFIAIIIVLDTFQRPISRIVPNIEFLLYNLYESILDIKLFIYDLT